MNEAISHVLGGCLASSPHTALHMGSVHSRSRTLHCFLPFFTLRGATILYSPLLPSRKQLIQNPCSQLFSLYFHLLSFTQKVKQCPAFLDEVVRESEALPVFHFITYFQRANRLASARTAKGIDISIKQPSNKEGFYYYSCYQNDLRNAFQTED